MSNPRMARADLVTGAILFALSVAVVAGSWNMDRLEARRIHPLSAPGFTPGLLGLALAVASIILIVQAVRRGGARRLEGSGTGRMTADAYRLWGTLVLCLVYALGLIGRMPYWLATALFVASFVAIFEWNEGGTRWIRLVWAIGIGLAVGLGVSYVFSELFLVRLP